MQTRRHFLRDCSLAAATATVAPVSGWAVQRAGRQWSPDSALAGGFAALVNTPFAVRTGFGVTKLVLEQVVPAPPVSPAAEDADNERFSLFFRGPVREPLDQDTYLFEHARMGNMAIFITRIGSLDIDNCYYEAVFNHPVSPQALAAQRSRAPRAVARD
jgi:hypothetical protein